MTIRSGLGRRGAVTIALVLAILAGGAWAAAEVTPDASETIQGCYNKKTGALKVLRAGSECGGNETPISWNETGPTGETGAQGPKGSDGADGAQGPPGPRGEPGPNLIGSPCSRPDGINGTITMQIDAVGAVQLRCTPGTPSTEPPPPTTTTTTPTTTTTIPTTTEALQCTYYDPEWFPIGRPVVLGDPDTYPVPYATGPNGGVYHCFETGESAVELIDDRGFTKTDLPADLCADWQPGMHPAGMNIGPGPHRGSTLLCIDNSPPVETWERCNEMDDDADWLIDETFPKLGENAPGSNGDSIDGGTYICGGTGAYFTFTYDVSPETGSG